MTDNEIRKLVQEEIKACFEKLTLDVQEMKRDYQGIKKGVDDIKRLLKGDKDYDDVGYAKKIKFSYDHARKVADSEFMQRTEEVVEHCRRWDREGKWQILNDMIDKYKILKWLAVLVGGGAIISVINLITTVVLNIVE